jgi:choline dehydrogenase-like flavoprotein
MIRSGRDLTGDRIEEADAVVIGTGAGGGMALRELARAGLKVIALEEGGYHTTRDFNQREPEMFAMLFQERGGRATADFAIRVLQGRGVGGSTIHNTNLCKRIPDPILEQWEKEHAVSECSPKDLAPVFGEVERELSVSEIAEESRNENNRILARGVRALGFRGGPLRHNRVGCRESGFCELGCAYDAKQNVTKVLLPPALATGNASVVSDARATRILHEGGKVTGVEAMPLGEDGRAVGRLVIRSRVVVLSASAVGSAALALASGIPDPNDRLGRGLRLHPGGAVAGFFDSKVEGFSGIPQSYECTEFLEFSPGSSRRAWITTAFAHPIGAAAFIPGFGAAHMALMRRYAQMSVLTAMVHDETAGRVVLADGVPKLEYRMSDGDREQLALGLRGAARILLAAGAREVVVPSVPPLSICKDIDVEAIDTDLIGPHKVPLTAVHPLGTMPLGDDPRSAVVKSTGEHHHVTGLFVFDGSLFPTSIGVPPQIGIYTFAKHLAKHAIARARQ